MPLPPSHKNDWQLLAVYFYKFQDKPVAKLFNIFFFHPHCNGFVTVVQDEIQD